MRLIRLLYKRKHVDFINKKITIVKIVFITFNDNYMYFFIDSIVAAIPLSSTIHDRRTSHKTGSFTQPVFENRNVDVKPVDGTKHNRKS